MDLYKEIGQFVRNITRDSDCVDADEPSSISKVKLSPGCTHHRKRSIVAASNSKKLFVNAQRESHLGQGQERFYRETVDPTGSERASVQELFQPAAEQGDPCVKLNLSNCEQSLLDLSQVFDYFVDRNIETQTDPPATTTACTQTCAAPTPQVVDQSTQTEESREEQDNLNLRDFDTFNINSQARFDFQDYTPQAPVMNVIDRCEGQEPPQEDTQFVRDQYYQGLKSNQEPTALPARKQSSRRHQQRKANASELHASQLFQEQKSGALPIFDFSRGEALAPPPESPEDGLPEVGWGSPYFNPGLPAMPEGAKKEEKQARGLLCLPIAYSYSYVPIQEKESFHAKKANDNFSERIAHSSLSGAKPRETCRMNRRWIQDIENARSYDSEGESSDSQALSPQKKPVIRLELLEEQKEHYEKIKSFKIENAFPAFFGVASDDPSVDPPVVENLGEVVDRRQPEQSSSEEMAKEVQMSQPMFEPPLFLETQEASVPELLPTPPVPPRDSVRESILEARAPDHLSTPSITVPQKESVRQSVRESIPEASVPELLPTPQVPLPVPLKESVRESVQELSSQGFMQMLKPASVDSFEGELLLKNFDGFAPNPDFRPELNEITPGQNSRFFSQSSQSREDRQWACSINPPHFPESSEGPSSRRQSSPFDNASSRSEEELKQSIAEQKAEFALVLDQIERRHLSFKQRVIQYQQQQLSLEEEKLQQRRQLEIQRKETEQRDLCQMEQDQERLARMVEIREAELRIQKAFSREEQEASREHALRTRRAAMHHIDTVLE